MLFTNARHEGSNKWWKYILTTVFVVFGMVLGSLPYLVAVYIGIQNKHPDWSRDQLVEGIMSMDNSLHDLDSNLLLVLMLLQFVLGFAMLYIFVRSLHLKRFSSLVSAKNKVDWSKIFKAFGVWFVLLLLMEVVGFLLHPENYVWNFQPEQFFVLLIIALLILPIQTSLEELLIRGYFLQGLGLLFKNRLVPIVLTAIIFAALHGANPEVEAYGALKMLTYFFLVGLFFAIITVMDDGLEIALGFHAANNIFVSTIVNTPDSALSTPALVMNHSADTDGMLITTAILFVVVLLVGKKTLGWGNWNRLWS